MKFKGIFGIVAVLVLLAAGSFVLQWFFRYSESDGMVARPLLPVEKLLHVRLVLIEGEEGRVTLRRGKNGWTVDEQEGFPADGEKLREFLFGLTRIRTAQKIPLHPERLGEFGLLKKVENQWRFEAGRTARVLSLIHGLEDRHKLIYRLLVGNIRRPSNAMGGGGTYIRFPSSNNVYLLRESLRMGADPEDWIDKTVFAPEVAGEIQAIHVEGPSGGTFLMIRDGADQPWRMPDGKDGRPPLSDPAALVQSLTGLRIASLGEGIIGEARAEHLWLRLRLRLFDKRTYQLSLYAEDGGEKTRAAFLSAWLVDSTAKSSVYSSVVDDPREMVDDFNGRFTGRRVNLQPGKALARLTRFLKSFPIR